MAYTLTYVLLLKIREPNPGNNTNLFLCKRGLSHQHFFPTPLRSVFERRLPWIYCEKITGHLVYMLILHMKVGTDIWV
jgi:hypothetical protein